MCVSIFFFFFIHFIPLYLSSSLGIAFSFHNHWLRVRILNEDMTHTSFSTPLIRKDVRVVVIRTHKLRSYIFLQSVPCSLVSHYIHMKRPTKMIYQTISSSLIKLNKIKVVFSV